MAKDVFTFKAPVWEWEGKAAWFFVTVPPELSDEIGVRYATRTAGFGSLKVEATLGPTTWQTSIFPDKRGWALPLKKQVRTAAGIDADDVVSVRLRIIV